MTKKTFTDHIFQLLRRNHEICAVTYHKISNAENFENQLCYLKERFHIIGYQDVKGFFAGNLLPKNALILTFDDGDISNYKIAFPLLKKHGIPAIFFVITDLLNTHKPFWWDEIEYYLGKEEGNRKIWEVKTWPNAKREAFLQDLRKMSNKPVLEQTQLTTDQLREMQESGIVIANHSHTHPMFDQCTSEELHMEMSQSTAVLKELGFSPEIFAYPNGNFSVMAEERLKKHGIQYSFLFDHKINKSTIDPLRISRLIVNDTTPLWKLKFILSGWHSKILPITKRIGKLVK